MIIQPSDKLQVYYIVNIIHTKVSPLVIFARQQKIEKPRLLFSNSKEQEGDTHGKHTRPPFFTKNI